MKIKRNGWVGLAWLSPTLLFVSVFVLWPMVHLVWLSFTSTSLLGGGEWVGFKNYTTAFNDPKFWAAFRFTLLYTVILTPILMGLGFALALLVSPNTPLRRVTRTVTFLPVVIGLASSSLLWFWLFDQQVGLFNRLLVDLNILSQPLVWFRKVDTAMIAVIISVTWKVVGFGMILIMAGIQSIPSDLFEAARIDGASLWLRVRRIILPLALRSILMATVLSVIGSMLAFDQFYLMTGGGPRGKTFTSVYWIYQNSFVRFDLGYGAALSVILMLVIMAMTALQLTLQSRGKA
ncbi:carbohydrate ABC transporter permease [Neogemmobacter tilapiae]|uniref:Sugar ABC transporter permease n=1 Tax=Neogemmobacter tilapiae TaxID=875041 RepID=A0A918WKI2_9RHOB|nr:sugar ABC transporter permease [Gemmobacter tilapiae]GHC51317.1 sugar ABC transporter permease [Gemmobacter tilapiae]